MATGSAYTWSCVEVSLRQIHSARSDTAGSQSLRNRYVTPAPRPTAISSVSAKRIGVLEVAAREGGRPGRRELLLAIFLGRLAGGLSGPCEVLGPAQEEFEAVGDGGCGGPGPPPAADAPANPPGAAGR